MPFVSLVEPFHAFEKSTEIEYPADPVRTGSLRAILQVGLTDVPGQWRQADHANSAYAESDTGKRHAPAHTIEFIDAVYTQFFSVIPRGEE